MNLGNQPKGNELGFVPRCGILLRLAGVEYCAMISYFTFVVLSTAPSTYTLL